MKTPPPITKKNDSSSAEYYVHVNDGQFGPYDFEKIKILLEIKTIDKNTLIWKELMDDWDKVSNLEEFKILINLSEVGIKSIKEKVIKNQNKSLEIKTNSDSKAFIKLFNITSIIILVVGCLALIGAVQQYIGFIYEKDLDLSYIGPWSAWGGLISAIISLIIIIYFKRNKTKILISLISLIVGASAVIIILYTESEFRKYYKPLWEMQSSHLRMPMIRAREISEGWRMGLISEDSLIILFNSAPTPAPQKTEPDFDPGL